MNEWIQLEFSHWNSVYVFKWWIDKNMKHMKCDICGFEAGIFTEDLYSKKMICIECLNRIKHGNEREDIYEATRVDNRQYIIDFRESEK